MVQSCLLVKSAQNLVKFRGNRPNPKDHGAPRGGRTSRRIQSPREPAEEVVENFKDIVRQAREKKGWSREELGDKIYEKASVVNRIESGKMVPDLKLARKIEKIMKIVLIEKTDDVSADETGHSKVRGATIGDIATNKKELKIKYGYWNSKN